MSKKNDSSAEVLETVHTHTHTHSTIKRNIIIKLKQIFSKNWIKWACLISCLLVAYVIFIYDDMTHTIDNSITFAKSLLNGRVLEFYELSVEFAKTRYAANYSTLIYLLLAIWNLPVWAISGVVGENFSTWWLGLLWGKTFIVSMALATAYLVYKILILCNVKKERAYLGVFLFTSSMTFFEVIFAITQLDIVAAFLMLLGVYGYFKKNNILFFISFMIAVPLKMFALFLALPLILIRQKNLLKAGATWGSMTVLLVIEKILYSGSAVYKYALGAQSRDAISQLLNSRISNRKTNYNIFSNIYLPSSLYISISRKRE